ncbi:MAG: hypothetical protein RIS50_1300 [Bacteroidota bacterium]
MINYYNNLSFLSIQIRVFLSNNSNPLAGPNRLDARQQNSITLSGWSFLQIHDNKIGLTQPTLRTNAPTLHCSSPYPEHSHIHAYHEKPSHP